MEVEDEGEEEEEDSPLLLEALLSSNDPRHQTTAVSLLHTLMESPQVKLL